MGCMSRRASSMLLKRSAAQPRLDIEAESHFELRLIQADVLYSHI